MNQILSQSEVDALLAAVSDGDVATPSSSPSSSSGGGGSGSSKGSSSFTGAAADKNVITYDLTSQDRIIRGRLPQLEVIYEKFMRAFRVSLSSALRKIASITLTSTEFIKFGEFINTLPIPTCMSVLRFNNLRGSALFVIEAKLAYALVDSFFGGSDRPYSKLDGKEFTPIELQIVKKVVELAINDLEQAWSTIEVIGCSFQRTEINPQFVGIVPPTDVVIASTFDIELENINGTVSIVIPYATIEPIRQKLSTGFQVESDQTDKKLWTAIIKEQLLDTNISVKVNLGETEIKLKDMMGLKVGDVIPLTQDSSGELDIQVEEVKKFKGYYGIHHGTVAVQVTRQIEK